MSGDDVIIVPTVSDEDARTRFPEGWRTVKPYMRVVQDPKNARRPEGSSLAG